MAKSSKKIPTQSWQRSLSASLAGIRAGGALAVDSALNKTLRNNASENDRFALREARRFARQLGKLKGSYVKIGQMMALFGEHFLPAPLTQALHELGDSAQPLDWQSIEPELVARLGENYRLLAIEQTPLAAASLAQAHRATIKHSGETLCLKAQYPDLAAVIDADFDTVVRLLVLARWLKAGQELDEWLASMREQLHLEIDYLREAKLTQHAASLTKSVAAREQRSSGCIRLHVPKVYPQYSGEKLLALELIQGVSVNDSKVQQLPKPRRNAIAKTMLDLFFREVFEWGLLQTDPNFGNYLLQLQDRRKREADDTLVLLDYGAAVTLPVQTQHALQQVIIAGLKQNMPQLIKGLQALGWLKADASDHARETFAGFCIDLLEPLRPAGQLPAAYLNKAGEYCWSQSQLIQRAGKQGARNASSRHFSPPARDFMLLARKLTGVFTFIAVLDAEFNGYTIAEKYITQWQQHNKPGC